MFSSPTNKYVRQEIRFYLGWLKTKKNNHALRHFMRFLHHPVLFSATSTSQIQMIQKYFGFELLVVCFLVYLGTFVLVYLCKCILV